MFAYIDESGHTGAKLQDQVQPIFYYGALISRYNINVLLQNKIKKLCKSLKIDRLHASELGSRNELVAGQLETLLRKYSPRFVIAEVEKRHLALTKMFDTIFDSGENFGARNHIYSFRALRLLLLYNFSKLINEDISYKFYDNCLFAETQEVATKSLIEICEESLSLFSGQFDERTNELISDALIWAIRNPEKISIYNMRKEDRWRHLPNVAAFVPTLQELSSVARRINKTITRITHDEQIQMKKILEEAHRFSSYKHASAVMQFADNPAIWFKQLKNSQFLIESSFDNVGLQLIDFILYNWKKKDYIYSHKTENPNSFNFINFYYPKTKFFYFTYKQLELECIETIKWISNLPLTDVQIKEGKKIVDRLENKFLEKNTT